MARVAPPRTVAPPGCHYTIPPGDTVLHYVHTVELLTRREAQQVIDDCEEHAGTHGGWEVDRHSTYPTEDLRVDDVKTLSRWLYPIIGARLMPAVADAYGLGDPRVVNVADMFVARYAALGQRRLAPHRDNSVLSFNVLLNDAADFDGGGTYIHELNATVQGAQGTMLLHSGKWMHEGAPVTRGMRYLLVGFILLDDSVLNTTFTDTPSFSTNPLTWDDRKVVNIVLDADVKQAAWDRVGKQWRSLAAEQAGARGTSKPCALSRGGGEGTSGEPSAVVVVSDEIIDGVDVSGRGTAGSSATPDNFVTTASTRASGEAAAVAPSGTTGAIGGGGTDGLASLLGAAGLGGFVPTLNAAGVTVPTLPRLEPAEWAALGISGAASTAIMLATLPDPDGVRRGPWAADGDAVGALKERLGAREGTRRDWNVNASTRALRIMSPRMEDTLEAATASVMVLITSTDALQLAAAASDVAVCVRVGHAGVMALLEPPFPLCSGALPLHDGTDVTVDIKLGELLAGVRVRGPRTRVHVALHALTADGTTTRLACAGCDDTVDVRFR